MSFISYCALQADRITYNETLVQDIRNLRFKNAVGRSEHYRWETPVEYDWPVRAESTEAGYRKNKILYV